MGNRLFKDNDGIDEDACLKMYDGNYDFYRTVLEALCKEIGQTFVKMQETFDAKDMEKEGKWEEAQKFHQPILDELQRLMTLIPERLEEYTK